MQARIPGRVLAAVAVTMLVAAGGADGSQRWIRGLPVVMSDDDRYEGARRDGQPHGHGVLSSSSFGYRYEGELRYGQPHGHGVYTNGPHHDPERFRYEGGFYYGLLHGQGVITAPLIGHIEGEFVYGLQYGQGVHTFPGGSRYEGEFIDGERYGYGVRTSSGGERDAGMFYKGRFLGRCSRDGHESGSGGSSPSGNPR